MNRCARSGYLVDATSTLPSDPTDFQVEGLPVVGCTRIRCGRCGAFVRNAPGLAFRTRDDVSASELAALYALTDLASSPLLHQVRPEWRLYVCKCSRWLETSAHACAEPDPDANTDPDMPWRCEGHPSIALPHDIDGASVSSPSELRELATRGFHGVTPPRVRPADAERGDWLARLYSRLDPGGPRGSAPLHLRPGGRSESDPLHLGPPDAAVVVEVALSALEDPAVRTRALALRFFYDLPIEAGRARLLALLEGDRRLFAGVPDEVTTVGVDKTLEHSMWRIVAPLVATPGRAQDLARAEALSGKAGLAVYDALAKYDSAWVSAHGEELVRAAPERMEEIFSSFSQFPQGVPIRALRERIRKVIAP